MSNQTVTMMIDASGLAKQTAQLNASIERFLSGMDQHQARLDGYADEVARLTARITDLEAKLASK